MKAIILDLKFENIESVTKLYVDSVQKYFKNTLPDEELYMWTYESEKKAFINNFNKKDLTVRVATDENQEIIGFSRFGNDKEKQELGWIDLIFVRDDFHKKGIGSMLFNDAKKLLKEKGFSKIHLWAPTKGFSHGFYLKLNGQNTGKKINEIGFDLTEYSWNI